MRSLFLSMLLPLVGFGQMPTHYKPKGHSHNDYAGSQPFTLAYSKGFGSIEADVFLVHDTLWVGHVPKDVEQRRSLEDLYLRPLETRVKANHGHAYPDKHAALQMMIDIKTAAGPTLDALVREIRRHPDLLHAGNLIWTISGNRPPDSSYTSYPGFIRFDGDIVRAYDEKPLDRIPMMSADLLRVIPPHPPRVAPLEGILDSISVSALKPLITRAHEKGKKVRFWNAPDDPAAWKALLELGVDYINTDKVEAFSEFAR